MRVWLASYPRSGNTFLRIVLNNVFGLKSTSLYKGENAVFDKFLNVSSLIGSDEERPGEEQLRQEKCGTDLIKTHQGPIDDAPGIYIVRDGRMAVVSYYYYLKSFTDEEADFRNIISGKQWPGSWSDHFNSWDPVNRKQTLLLRYEDLRSDVEGECRKIGEFLQVEPRQSFKISFSELQKLNPQFFRSADDAKSLADIQPFIDLFLEHHGPTMRELGYLKP
jgi:hypothetical protein